MGIHPNVSYDRYPKQSETWPVGTQVEVCFDYNARRVLKGTVLRNDVEEPYLMLIKLEDGRIVRDAECQYRPISKVDDSDTETLFK